MAQTLTEFLANLSEIIVETTVWFNSAMEIFMEPPLVIFVGLTLFASIIYLVKSLLHR